MRTISRLTVSALALGGSFALGPVASAQEACPYPFDPANPVCVDDTSSDRGPSRTTDATSTEVASTLPFTGGEITMLTLVGAGALAGGIGLIAAGRKRQTG